VKDIVFYTNKTPPRTNPEYSRRSREVVRGGFWGGQRTDHNCTHTHTHTQRKCGRKKTLKRHAISSAGSVGDRILGFLACL
jgi:hypothetical protein